MAVAAIWAGVDRDVASLQREVGLACSRSAQATGSGDLGCVGSSSANQTSFRLRDSCCIILEKIMVAWQTDFWGSQGGSLGCEEIKT